jgi:hypothetical protein
MNPGVRISLDIVARDDATMIRLLRETVDAMIDLSPEPHLRKQAHNRQDIDGNVTVVTERHRDVSWGYSQEVTR